MDPPSYKRPRTGGEDGHIQPHKKVRPRPTSGFYGVYAKGKRWQTMIRYDSKKHCLGSFDTKQEAALAYDRKARQCGKDKLLNYESIKAAEDAAVQAQDEHIFTHPKQPKPRPTSGFYGVSAAKKRWQAVICYDNTNYSLGSFDTKQEAALAYDRKARQCGKDKLLNYESIKAAEDAAVQAQAQHTLVHDLCARPHQLNARPSSGFYGVHVSGKRWKAVICYDSKNHSLGSFDTKQEAALAYDRKARQCGKDKPLNCESIAAAEDAAVQAQAKYILMHGICTGPKQPKPRPKSGFYGVSAHKKRWRAQIRYDSNQYSLGSFDTKQEAAFAYDRAARQCGGDKSVNYESIQAAEEAAAEETSSS
jgi:hypothetical protein